MIERVHTPVPLPDAQGSSSAAQRLGHDLNNVLTVILTYSTFLEASLEASDSRHADAVEIVAAARRAVQLTRQLAIELK